MAPGQVRRALPLGDAGKAANVVASSSDSDKNYGSLKSFWVARTGNRWPKTCAFRGCSNAPTLGGHVWVKDEMEPQIVPICASCNRKRALD